MTLFSCWEKPTSARQNKITKLTFATGGCFGECPFLAIEIDSALNYKFYGGQYAGMKGCYRGKISATLWDTVNIKFESLQFRSLDTNTRSVDDMSIQNVIHFGDVVTKIERQEMELPKDVRENFYWLMETYKQVKLKKVTDTILFETIIQKGAFQIPPPPTERQLNDAQQ